LALPREPRPAGSAAALSATAGAADPRLQYHRRSIALRDYPVIRSERRIGHRGLSRARRGPSAARTDL